MKELSKAEKLLLAAADLTASGREEFSAEDLAVRAHKLFPYDFAMKGYAEYPDSNVVFTQVMGKKAALIVRNWLEKTGTKQYRLTLKGVDDATMLKDGEMSTSVNLRIDRQFEDPLSRLLQSQAYQLFRTGDQDEITFHQFCRFVELSARDRWQKVQGKLAAVEHLVGKAKQLGEAGEGVSIWVRDHNERFSPEDLRLLEPLLKFLQHRFKREMDEWSRKANG